MVTRYPPIVHPARCFQPTKNSTTSEKVAVVPVLNTTTRLGGQAALLRLLRGTLYSIQDLIPVGFRVSRSQEEVIEVLLSCPIANTHVVPLIRIHTAIFVKDTL